MPLEVQSPRLSTAEQEEIYAELELLVHSSVFNRSEKLQAFLRFVCETAVRGNGSQINEHLIGIEVFKRGRDYSPSEDSIVRRHAHALRQKLQEYYSTEGAGHAVRIEMPVGRYVPVFRRKEDQLPEVTPAEPQLGPVPVRRNLTWIAVPIAAIAIFASGWIAADLHLSKTPGLSAPMREIWGAWIGNDAVLCFSNPASASVRHVTEPAAADTTMFGVRAHPDQELVFQEKFGFSREESLYFLPTIAQTMMGEASVATYLAAVFARTGTPLRTMESRFLSWENLRRENHVLLGGDAQNRWVDSVLENYPFRLTSPADGSPRSIVNTAPHPGEPRTFAVVGSSEARKEYALISMVPGVAADRQFLIICGVNSPATPLATEYLTTEHGLTQLVDRLHAAAPRHSGGWHFQVVIQVDLRDKVPTRASIAALRVL